MEIEPSEYFCEGVPFVLVAGEKRFHGTGFRVSYSRRFEHAAITVQIPEDEVFRQNAGQFVLEIPVSKNGTETMPVLVEPYRCGGEIGKPHKHVHLKLTDQNQKAIVMAFASSFKTTPA